MLKFLKPGTSLFILLFLLGSFLNVQGQTQNKSYQEQSIYLKGNKYVKNGEVYPNGFFMKKLKKEIEVSPDAVLEFQKYEKNRNIGLVFSTISLAAFMSTIAIDNDDVNLGLLIGGTATGLVSIPFFIKSTNQLNKAIWVRNGFF